VSLTQISAKLDAGKGDFTTLSNTRRADRGYVAKLPELWAVNLP
jgi:hypothetical protein